uniref:ATP phosphoribosyltransferase-like protein n=1 Tax=uncultured microorganism TaxID=358574 RepID=I3PGA2_9ZZZZ|nr:ATP phosphoribosyltransferase-like protein [uncultured microorganism]
MPIRKPGKNRRRKKPENPELRLFFFLCGFSETDSALSGQCIICHTVFHRNFPREGFSFRRCDPDPEGILSFPGFRHQGNRPARPARFVDLRVQFFGQLMHMGIVDRSGSPAQDGFDRVHRNKVSFLKGSGGESLVQQEQAPAGAFFEQIPEPPAFLAQPAQVQRLVLIRRKMCQDPVRRIEIKRFRRYGNTALRQQEQLPDSLGNRGFSAAVGAGQDVHSFFGVESQVIAHHTLRLFRRDQLQVVESFRVRAGIFPGSLPDPGRAEGPSFRAAFFNVFRPAGIKGQFRNQIGNVFHTDVQIFSQSVPQLPGNPGCQHRRGAVHLARHSGRTVCLRHPCQGEHRQRIAEDYRTFRHMPKAFQKAGSRIGGIIAGASVPVRLRLNFILRIHGGQKILQQAGSGERFGVDRDQSQVDCFKAVVQIDPHRQAFYRRGGYPHFLNILAKPGKPVVPVNGFHRFPQIQHAFGFQILIRQAFPDLFHCNNIVVVLFQTVHQVPDAAFVVLVPPDHTVIIEHFHLVQQLCHLFADFRMMQDILKNPAPESRYSGIRRQAPHDLLDHRHLLGFCGNLFRHGIQSQVMPRLL